MNPLSFEAAKHYREELLRQAAQDHLARLATEKADHPRLLGPALVKIGDWMIVLGTRLKTHYGDILTPHHMPISTKTLETGA